MGSLPSRGTQQTLTAGTPRRMLQARGYTASGPYSEYAAYQLAHLSSVLWRYLLPPRRYGGMADLVQTAFGAPMFSQSPDRRYCWLS